MTTTRATELYLGEGGKRVRELLTPEGVPIRMVRADTGSRIGAFVLDMIFAGVVLTALGLLAYVAVGAGEWIGAFVAIAGFAIVNFYFVFFELRWQGSTPGKRIIGLRVVDAEGGPLRADSIFARNLVRDVELFVPIAVILSPEQIGVSATSAVAIVALLWCLALLLFPLFNRNRQRIGDLVGGTLVVLSPRARLLPDVGGVERGDPSAAGFSFTAAQLDVYGIYELQVLESVLRGSERIDASQAVHAVCARICRKIRWPGPFPADPRRFLSDYYAALRARLENKKLLGDEVADKYSAEQRRRKSSKTKT